MHSLSSCDSPGKLIINLARVSVLLERTFLYLPALQRAVNKGTLLSAYQGWNELLW